MFGDMMGKLQEMQQNLQVSKDKLSQLRIEAEAGNGAVKIVMDGNKKLLSISFEDSMCLPERKEELEDYTVLAFQKALAQAEEKWEEEMKGSAGSLFSGLGL